MTNTVEEVVFAFSADELRRSQVDAEFAGAAQAIRDRGFRVFATIAEEGKLLTRGDSIAGCNVVYRGWMLNEEHYREYVLAVQSLGGHVVNSVEEYLVAHHIPGWYRQISDLTPRTKFFAKDADLKAELLATGWDAFVLKDYVKSLKTSLGAVIRDPNMAPKVAEEMLHYRGEIEGGYSVREFEAFNLDSERRYFVVHGQPFGADGTVPSIVADVARRLVGSNFYSVDVVQRDDGVMRVVEIGDGQVSDLVGWSDTEFAAIWC